ncbi:hypothetical protein [Klebsiella pneumoniae]|nr:hypothetical protein [Klebsiella pneumoniae]
MWVGWGKAETVFIAVLHSAYGRGLFIWLFSQIRKKTECVG